MPRTTVGDRDRAGALRSLAVSLRTSLRTELGEPAAYDAFMELVQGRFLEVNGFGSGVSESPGIERVRAVLTPEICADVEVIGWLHQAYRSDRKDEIFAGFMKRQKAGPAEIPAATQLFTPHWIVRYLVENSLGRLWLLNHPDSRLAEQMPYYVTPLAAETEFLRIDGPEELRIMDPAYGSGHLLTYAFDLLHAIYTEAGYDTAEIPRLILTHNLYGAEIDPEVAALASFALRMKARQRGCADPPEPNLCVLRPVVFTTAELALLPGAADFWNQFEHADTVGSLIRPEEPPGGFDGLDQRGGPDHSGLADRVETVLEQAAYLTRLHHVVVANPPYMGSKNMGDLLSARLRTEQPGGRMDLYAAFIERAMTLALPGGLVGLITMQGWMFLDSYASLRTAVRERWSVVTLSHLGPSAFEDVRGQVVTTAAFVLRNRPSDEAGSYFRLVDVPGDDKARVALAAYRGELPGRRFDLDVHALGALPGGELAYWLTPALLRAFADLPPISARVDTRSGMATGDNDRFLRSWWEVAGDHLGLGLTSAAEAVRSGTTWVPYNKGGRARRWSGNNELVVHWRNDGELIKASKAADLAAGRITTNNARCWNQDRYFQPSVTWTAIGNGRLAARYADPGSIFDTKGQCLFVEDEQDRLFYLALLNSGVAGRFLQALAPTLDFHSGAIRRLPDPYANADRPRIAGLAREAIEIQRRAGEREETSRTFVAPSYRPGRLRDHVAETEEQCRRETERLREIEAELDSCFARAYGDPTPVEPAPVTDLTRTPAESARDLVSYAVGCLLGRYELAGVTPVPDNVLPVGEIAERFRGFLGVAFGDAYVEENLRFVAESLGVEVGSYVATSFYADHVRRYRKRPIYWLFAGPRGGFQALACVHRYSTTTVPAVLDHLRAAIPAAGSARKRSVLERYADVLEPLAAQQIELDLDDGVKVNYARLGPALKRIPGLSNA